MTNSRRKGKRGELMAAQELQRLFGVQCRRGVQYQGGVESPDVCGLYGVHIEVKNVQKFNAYQAMAQAVEDCGENVPLVLHKRNHSDWLAVVRLDDLPALAVNLFHVLSQKES